MLPHNMPATDPKSMRRMRRAKMPSSTTGTNVSRNPSNSHSAPSGRMTVSKKCVPASSPRHARYIDRPSARSIRLALYVV